MKSFNEVDVKSLNFNVFSLFDDRWLLLTAGQFSNKAFNTMTISWGSMGIMWNRPFAQVVVRPTRFTFQFMNRFDYFTLCAFPEAYRPALSLLGTKSGRDGDKIAEAGLTPFPLPEEKSVAFEEADLIVVCKKIYQDDFHPENFLDPAIEDNYAQNDYHRIYFGEVVRVLKKKNRSFTPFDFAQGRPSTTLREREYGC
ncbi:flavin reductase [Caldithrix abyssi]|uniref:NADH-FMN oxidoreductase RutF, flavin reductase (DIM6/NTAB) family n=1 Tax=Caldithrix abyssi DSM 13497 TaxID=880073 RepID=A0A1J1CBA1_CALAY|nr:hypothetical protein [Caldithrix abyssi]APF19814.1 NADH-FMN oxidoreductase RutF, flavin reductase (DIM6/NTAB) family [Caldithrix abyssi DSM 13497]